MDSCLSVIFLTGEPAPKGLESRNFEFLIWSFDINGGVASSGDISSLDDVSIDLDGIVSASSGDLSSIDDRLLEVLQ